MLVRSVKANATDDKGGTGVDISEFPALAICRHSPVLLEYRRARWKQWPRPALEPAASALELAASAAIESLLIQHTRR
jgi:hypothetical protein